MSIVNQIDVNDSPYDIKSKDPKAEDINVKDNKGIITTAGENVTEQQMFDSLAEQTKQYTNFFEQIVPVSSEDVTITIACDSSLTDDSMLDIYTTKYGVVPRNIVVDSAAHTIRMTFKPQTTSFNVAVRVMKNKGGV